MNPGSSKSVSILRVSGDGAGHREDAVATEEPLEIQLAYRRRGGIAVTKNVAVTMRTPGDDEALAAGFLLTEGILRARDQIDGIAAVPSQDGREDPGNRVRVTLREGVEVDLRALERHFYTTSSCGVCGKTSLEAIGLAGGIALDPDTPRLEAAVISLLPERLRGAQAVFDQTGGLHGAALFDASGRLIAAKEDVGRHNAVDKLIGSQFLAGNIPLSGGILMVSGRASFELMQKAIMAGIPVLAAVGAPSTLAVEVARQFGATLLGFVREGRFNVYSGAQRLGGIRPERAEAALT